jgi:hypothetical protein
MHVLSRPIFGGMGFLARTGMLPPLLPHVKVGPGWSAPKMDLPTEGLA